MDRDALACDILIAAFNGGMVNNFAHSFETPDMLADRMFALADAMIKRCTPAPEMLSEPPPPPEPLPVPPPKYFGDSSMDAAAMDAGAREYPAPPELPPLTPGQLAHLMRRGAREL